MRTREKAVLVLVLVLVPVLVLTGLAAGATPGPVVVRTAGMSPTAVRVSSSAAGTGASAATTRTSVAAGTPAAAGGAAAARPAAAWSWPIAPPHVVVRPYLAPPTPYGAGHRGIDIRAPAGSPVLAPDDGVVNFAGVVVDRPVLSVRHADEVLSSFEPVTSPLHQGDVVHRGDVIGVLEAGHCDASPCVHLGARVHGRYVNPLVFLGGVPHAVLYPTRAAGPAPREQGRRSAGPGTRAATVADAPAVADAALAAPLEVGRVEVGRVEVRRVVVGRVEVRRVKVRRVVVGRVVVGRVVVGRVVVGRVKVRRVVVDAGRLDDRGAPGVTRVRAGGIRVQPDRQERGPPRGLVGRATRARRQRAPAR